MARKNGIFLDTLIMGYDGYNGIRRGWWEEAKNVFEDILTMAKDYDGGMEGVSIFKINITLYQKILHDLNGSADEKRKLRQNFKSNFMILGGCRSGFCLETSQMMTRQMEKKKSVKKKK